MTTVDLAASGQVVLDASGNGTAKVGPIGAGEVWSPAVASVHIPGTIVNSPVCKVYVGPTATDTTFIDGTWTGEQDSTGNVVGSTVRVGQFVFAVWTGGDAGAQATLNVTGTKEVP